MGQTGLREQLQKARIWLRRIQHYKQATKNVSRPCRFFRISRGQFYFWLRHYRQIGFHGLKAQKRGPRRHSFTTIARTTRSRSPGTLGIARPRPLAA